ncbi:efflux RND transporter periplasmic adaptor subunit [Roseisalinus antarcticus]|uniref:Cobalt-zinc-cadmium resistance protein CzcB n=1 Tax=Roseisalinus antarcticus TaxID=254357 RepID=A0A1Y5TK56_9RHOB|nr:efflux RND transporter periplasmic adaptor subunit [Roseisalinus antarcticus]SLN65976.1 Cobalt-zinc-cadmium resistance protein CzcB [Roseisalinus antarcticus]
MRSLASPCLVALLLLPGSIVAAQDAVYDCVIEPALTVEIASAEGGTLQEVLVGRGDTVSRGDVLARLDSTVEETTVALMEERSRSDAGIIAQVARLQLSQSQLDRVSTLVERNIGAVGQLEEAQATVEVARGDLSLARLNQRIAALEFERAQETLDRRTIRSPIDGVIVERLLYSGEYADRDKPIFVIAQIDPLHVEVFLPVEIFGSVEIGREAIIDPAPPIEGRYTGTITVIDRVFDAASGTFGLRVDLENPAFEVPAGHRCTVRF